MPIPIEEFQNPSFIRLKDRYTVGGIENQKARFSEINYYIANDIRRYRNGYPNQGYNPNHDSTRIERIRIDSDDVTYKGR